MVIAVLVADAGMQVLNGTLSVPPSLKASTTLLAAFVEGGGHQVAFIEGG